MLYHLIMIYRFMFRFFNWVIVDPKMSLSRRNITNGGWLDQCAWKKALNFWPAALLFAPLT